MNDFILYLILFGIFLIESIVLFNSIKQQFTIRKILKQDHFIYNKAKEAFSNGWEVPYGLWVRRTIGLLPKGLKNISIDKLEKKTEKEIKRIAGGVFRQTFFIL